MGHASASLRPPPACGPGRVRWFQDVWRAVADDAADQLHRLVDYGYSEEEAADVLEVWRESLHAQLDLTLDEAQTLGRWAA